MVHQKPNPFKRRFVRAAVQDNLNVMQQHWPRLSSQASARRPAWLNRGDVFSIVLALCSLFYVVAMPEPRQEAARLSLPQADATESKTPASLVDSSPTPAFESTASVSLSTEDIQADATAGTAPAPSATQDLINPDTLAVAPSRIDLAAFALPVRRIVLDPGHGGDDPGAVAAHGLTEKSVTLDIGLRLRALLQAASFEVRMTREKDETVSLARRAAFANDKGGDLFVSIHVNSVEPRRARVVETYYLGPTEDPSALQLAGIENRQSGYSLADFRRLLDGVYADVKRGESRKLAEAIQGALVRGLRKTNPTLTHGPVKTAPFVVLVGANMPAVLTEVACLSNTEEARLLASPDYRQQIAWAIFIGLQSYTEVLERTYTTRKESPS